MTVSAQAEREIRRAVDLQNAADNVGAAAIYDRLLEQYPDHPDLLHFRGIIFRQAGDFERASALIGRSVALEPERSRAHYDLGVALAAMKRRVEARAALERAVQLEPTLADAHYILGILARDFGDHDVAIKSLRNTIVLAPELREAFHGLCAEYRDLGEIDALLTTTEAGLVHHPKSGELHTYRSEALLSKGKLAEGWSEYAWRFQSGLAAIPDRRFDVPRWAGESLSGKSIAIWVEQGVGDIIMYASMIRDVSRVAARCVVQVPARLKTLFARSLSGVEITTGGDPSFPGNVDFESPIGNLGRWLRPTFDSFSGGEPYLTPDAKLVDEFRRKYRGGDRVLLVGMAWRSTNVPHDSEKTIELRFWGGILNIPGLRFVSLQYGDCAHEIDAARAGFGIDIIHDRSVDPLGDLDRHAAQIAAMDFVVSTGNSAAHIAAALGVSTLCLLPDTMGHGQRWYWFVERASCPWYRTLERVCRPRQGTWSWPLAVAATRLVMLAAAAKVMPAPGKYLGALANSYRRENSFRELAHVLTARLTLEPTNAHVAVELAKARRELGDTTGALAAIDSALAVEPRSAVYLNERGQILALAGRFEEAVQSYDRGLAIEPRSLPLLNNSGHALRQAGRAAAAVDRYRAALAQDPSHSALRLSLAGTLAESGHPIAARQLFTELLSAESENVEAHCQHAYVLLRSGQFEPGWRELRWRWRRPAAHVKPEPFGIKLWDGEDVAGRAILVVTEQGIGEEILAATMIPALLRTAGRVGILCSDRLIPLLSRSFPAAIVALRSLPLPSAVASFRADYLMTLSELGRLYRPSFSAFGRPAMVLRADPGRTDALRRRYTAHRPGNRLVGISWRSVHPDVGHLKSGRLANWTMLLSLSGFTFVNLQYGDTLEEQANLPSHVAGKLIHDDTIDPLIDLDQAAAQVAAMDVVISVSNSTAHLAGALGVPTWVMLHETRGRFWYWFDDQPRSPWYSNVKLHTAASNAGGLVPPDTLVERLQFWIGGRDGAAP